MEEENQLEYLASETESLLEDIFLSGFHGIRKSSLERLTELIQLYNGYGMKEGEFLLAQLNEKLIKRKESFSSQIDSLMNIYGKVEFYLEHLKSRLNAN